MIAAVDARRVISRTENGFAVAAARNTVVYDKAHHDVSCSAFVVSDGFADGVAPIAEACDALLDETRVRTLVPRAAFRP